MGKNGIHTYKQHVVKMLDRRLGAKEPLECTKEVSDVLMCWGTVFVSSTSQYDPTKCKVGIRGQAGQHESRLVADGWGCARAREHSAHGRSAAALPVLLLFSGKRISCSSASCRWRAAHSSVHSETQCGRSTCIPHGRDCGAAHDRAAHPLSSAWLPCADARACVRVCM